MQGNRDGSWSLRASAYGGSGNGNGGYLPQTTPVFHNYIVKQQQPIRYNFQTQQNLNFPHPQFGGGANVELIRIDKAVNNTRKSLIAAGDNVSSTRVSQSVLAQLQADTWRSLGIWMQDVPSLRQLMALEGKVKLKIFYIANETEPIYCKVDSFYLKPLNLVDHCIYSLLNWR